ncbi:MAG: hypothetical protein KF713_08945 [Turneriella sp.]|nr:hypothetical protein [Turneriella sp.]
MATYRKNSGATSKYAVWGKFSYRFTGAPVEILLSLRDRRIRSLEVFIFAADELVRQKNFDAAGAGGPREVSLHEYLVSLPARDAEVIFRAEADTAVQPDPHLLSWQTALAFENQLQVTFGIFFGAQAVLFVLSLFLFAALRETHYLYYALYTAGWLVFEIVARQFLSLGMFYDSGEAAPPILWIYFAQGFLLLFARRFLGFAGSGSRMGRALLAAAIVAFLLALTAGFKPERPMRILAGVFSSLTTASVLALALRSYLSGERNARLFIPAMLCLPVVAIVYAVMRFSETGAGRLTDFLILDFTIPGMTTLTAVFLGAALADRYRLLRDEGERRERSFAATLREEKQRINAELHDVVGSDLATMVLRLSSERSDPLLTEMGMRLRGILNRLREMVLLANSEEPGNLLTDMTERLREVAAFAGFRAAFEGEGIDAGKYEAFHLRRFFYEALTNAARHAGAGFVRVRFRNRGDWGSLIVADDGCGFEIQNATPGSGLTNLGERAHRLNGKFRLFSRRGRGTVLALRFPLRC